MSEKNEYLSRVIKSSELYGNMDNFQVRLDFEDDTKHLICISLGNKIAKKSRIITNAKELEKLNGKTFCSVHKIDIENDKDFKYGGFEIIIEAVDASDSGAKKSKKGKTSTKVSVLRAAYTSKATKNTIDTFIEG